MIFVFIFFWVFFFFDDKPTSELYFAEWVWFLTLAYAGMSLWMIFGYQAFIFRRNPSLILNNEACVRYGLVTKIGFYFLIGTLVSVLFIDILKFAFFWLHYQGGHSTIKEFVLNLMIRYFQGLVVIIGGLMAGVKYYQRRRRLQAVNEFKRLESKILKMSRKTYQ